MTEARRRLRDWMVPIFLVSGAFVCGVVLLASGKEISVWADFRRDVSVRDGYSLDEINDIRFYDSSPYSIWLPSDIFVWESLRRGELPLWDRSQAGGYSPVLNLQNGIMHPLRWATVIVPRAFAPSLLIVESLLFLCLGTFLMLRKVFERSEPASLLGAVVVVISGYVMSVVHFSGVVIPLVHVPWVVLAYTNWDEKRTRPSAMWVALVVALLALAGHPLIIIVAALLAGSLIAWKAVARRQAKDIAWGVALALSGILMTSFVTLPMALNLPNLWSYKSSTSEGVSYALLDGIGMSDALISMVTYLPYEADFLDGGPLAFHLGAVAAALMLVGMYVAARNRSTLIVTFLILLGWMLSVPTSGTVGLVSFTPIAYFKPWYLMFLFVFPATIAVALGFDRVLEALPVRARAAAAVLVFVAVVVPGLRPVREVLRSHVMSEVRARAVGYLHEVPEPFRVVGLGGQTHVPNVGAITGIEDVRFSSPVHPKRYHEWFGIVNGDGGGAYPTSTSIDQPISPMLTAFNVRYVLRSTVPGHDVQSFLPRIGDRPPRGYATDPPPDSDRFTRVFADESVEVYESRPGYHPRAHFAERFDVVSGGIEEAVERMKGLVSESEVEIVEVPPGREDSLSKVAPPAENDRLELSYESGRRVSIETSASGSRLVVVHDSWDRGWNARVDGESVYLFPVSVLSRGIIVPPGEHEIEMSFLPYGTLAGILISLLGLGLCSLIALRAR